jgi:membrane associated rhomboid family serine protease
MLPLKDLNPTRRTPFITYILIAVNVGVFLWMQLYTAVEQQEFFLRLSIVPVNITENPLALETLLDITRSMFFHGGWLHLIGNMLYLWLFGDNVEDRMGTFLYLILYFLSGIVAATTQILIDPYSRIPLIGASGAIGGILGGYLLLFPGVRVRGIIPLGRYARVQDWPAWAVLGLWFVLQVVYGALAIFPGGGASGGVAVFAHVGGFVFGMLYTWIFMKLIPQPPVEQRRDMLYDRAERYRY